MQYRQIIRRHALASGLVLLGVEAGLIATDRPVRGFHLLAAAGLWGYYLLLVYAAYRRWLAVQLPATGDPKTASPSPPGFWLAMGSAGYLLFWLATGVGVAWAGWLVRSQLTGSPQAGHSMAFFTGWVALSLFLFAAARLVSRRRRRHEARLAGRSGRRQHRRRRR
ncbi:MAG: hypothetical protein IMX00_05525 [Limnochordales bacterium]|nr:hypothetical protein [Limnochordales bacterium]